MMKNPVTRMILFVYLASVVIGIGLSFLLYTDSSILFVTVGIAILLHGVLQLPGVRRWVAGGDETPPVE